VKPDAPAHRRTARRTLIAGIAVIAALGLVGIPTPAAAHDQLVNSTPAPGARLDTPPEEITLTFSADLLVLDDVVSGVAVLVVDGDDRDWAAEDVEVFGDSVTVGVDPAMPVAGYQVRWQVVSQDGHPITGIIPFTIGDAAPLPAPDDEDEDGQPAPADDRDNGAAGTASDTSGMRTVVIGVVGAVAALVVVVLVVALRRRHAAASEPNTPPE